MKDDLDWSAPTPYRGCQQNFGRPIGPFHPRIPGQLINTGVGGIPVGTAEVRERRWRILLAVAGRGLSTTDEIWAFAGSSRVTVHRDLSALTRAGWLARAPAEYDKSHRWMYRATDKAIARVTEVYASQAAVSSAADDDLSRMAGDLLALLTSHTKTLDSSGLVAWRAGPDMALWLRQDHGVDAVMADAFGIWAQGEHAVRFLAADLRKDRYEDKTGKIHSLLAKAAQLPLNAFLLLANGYRQKSELIGAFHDIAPPPVVAIGLWSDLASANGPARRIWRLSHDPRGTYRLIDLAGPGLPALRWPLKPLP